MRARSERSARSPKATSSQGSSCAATARHSSGPTPAGSPVVSAMRGTLRLVFDVRFVPHAAQPQLGFLVGLAGADRFHRLASLELVGVVVTAVAEHLHDVPAELRPEGLADLVVLQPGDRLLELWCERSRPGPAEIAA